MTGWLIETFIWTGVLIALVLVLRRPVARFFGPKMAYALWALPLLRLVIPPIVLPSWMAPAEPVASEASGEAAREAPISIVETVPGEAISSAFAAAPAEASFAPSDLLLPVWLIGAFVFLVWRVVEYRKMRDELLAESLPVGEADDIRLIETPAVSSPVAFGVRDKVVALPPEFMAQDDVQARDLAIAHELEHHRGRDLIANFAAQPLLALHWFNPLAWLAWRAMRRDQEAACDARVVAMTDDEERAVYGQVIANFAVGPRLALAAPMACPILGEKSVIHRLRSLNMSDISSRRRKAGRFLLAGAALTLPLTASISYAESAVQDDAATEATAAQAPAAAQIESVDVDESNVTIIDVEEGAYVDDPGLHTRTIERDGKQFVLKTTEEISESEAEERIAKAEKSLKRVESEIEQETEQKGKKVRREIRIRKNIEGDGEHGHKHHKLEIRRHDKHSHMSAEDRAELRTEMAEMRKVMHNHFGPNGEFQEEIRIAMAEAREAGHSVAISCKGQGMVSTEEQNGKTKIYVCESKIRGHVAESIKKAREAIAKDPSIDNEVRTEILRSLDSEIAQMSQNG